MITVLCPTRGRPFRAALTLESFRKTTRRPNSRLVFVIDRDDPEFNSYLRIDAAFVALNPDQSGDLVRATNAVVDRFWDQASILGHVGDDHLFRTPGWDTEVETALARPGVAYGDDGIQGAAMPTAAFLSSIIVKTLGWMALPTAYHLFIDTTWKTIGERIDSLHYLPHVSIEHMHPDAGKAPMDEGYAKANSSSAWQHDQAAYEAWLAGPADDDIARVREAIG